MEDIQDDQSVDLTHNCSVNPVDYEFVQFPTDGVAKQFVLRVMVFRQVLGDGSAVADRNLTFTKNGNGSALPLEVIGNFPKMEEAMLVR